LGYLMKYLTEHVADYHQVQTPPSTSAPNAWSTRSGMSRAPDVRELAALWHPAQESAPGHVKAKPTGVETGRGHGCQRLSISSAVDCLYERLTSELSSPPELCSEGWALPTP
jgi:hypothetical protein